MIFWWFQREQKLVHLNSLNCEANQWTGFYVISASVMKGLILAAKFGGDSLVRIRICLYRSDPVVIRKGLELWSTWKQKFSRLKKVGKSWNIFLPDIFYNRAEWCICIQLLNSYLLRIICDKKRLLNLRFFLFLKNVKVASIQRMKPIINLLVPGVH